MKNFKDNLESPIFLIAILFLAIEFILFGGGLLVSLGVGAIFIYFGKNMNYKKNGKILFWIGVGIIVLTVLSMVTIRLFIIGFIIYLIYEYYKTRKVPNVIQPVTIIEEVSNPYDEPIIRRKPFIQNMIFGTQKTPEKPYIWSDVHILLGVGDTIIDLSNTVLPKEAVISIKGIAGNIQIYVPYDVEVSIIHSTLYGYTKIFNEMDERIINESTQYETLNYHTAGQKVKILTSLLVGKIEVRRI